MCVQNPPDIDVPDPVCFITEDCIEVSFSDKYFFSCFFLNISENMDQFKNFKF